MNIKCLFFNNDFVSFFFVSAQGKDLEEFFESSVLGENEDKSVAHFTFQKAILHSRTGLASYDIWNK